jgi:tol-pal system-associated acyl-CoA thioesterase
MRAQATAAEFVWPVRVYWEDTDAGGVVYYANYLRFMERARTEWLRSLGIEQMPLKEQHGVIMVVAHVEVTYRRPARYGDLLQVVSSLAEVGKVTLSFEQRVYRESVDGELLLEGRAKVGCIDAANFRPKALPKHVIGSLKAHE